MHNEVFKRNFKFNLKWRLTQSWASTSFLTMVLAPIILCLNDSLSLNEGIITELLLSKKRTILPSTSFHRCALVKGEEKKKNKRQGPSTMQLTEKGAADAYNKWEASAGSGRAVSATQDKMRRRTWPQDAPPAPVVASLTLGGSICLFALLLDARTPACAAPRRLPASPPTTTLLKVPNCLTKKCVAREVRYVRHPLRISKS